jgi:hypothetical protein
MSRLLATVETIRVPRPYLASVSPVASLFL